MDSMIVLAWSEVVKVHDGEPWASDLGQRPTFIPKVIANAVVWCRTQIPGDLERARSHADSLSATLYFFSQNDTDPLARARKKVLSCKITP